MATSKHQNEKMIGKRFVKFVKKAKHWCVTTFPNGIQKQEWFATKPEN